jgi:hypothetical protein
LREAPGHAVEESLFDFSEENLPIPANASNKREFYSMPQRVNALGANFHAVAQPENPPRR